MTKEIECPRCDEADYRSIGLNKCGLCECEFFVSKSGKATPAAALRKPMLSEMDIVRLCGGGRGRPR